VKFRFHYDDNESGDENPPINCDNAQPTTGVPARIPLPSFGNAELTRYKYCPGGPDLGVPTCVTILADVFHASTQVAADLQASNAADAVLFGQSPGPCCSNPSVTMVRDLVWQTGGGSDIFPNGNANGATFSITGDPTGTGDGTAQQTTYPPLAGDSVASNLIWRVNFCNPWPNYDLILDFDYSAAYNPVTELFNIGIFWGPTATEHNFPISPPAPGSGHFSIPITVDALGSYGFLFEFSIGKNDAGTPGSPSMHISNLQLRPLVPPVVLPPSCTVINTWSAPPNDNFANAQLIAGGTGSVNGNTVDGTLETGEPDTINGDPIQHSIWYKWVAPATGFITFNTTGTGFNAALAAYTGAAVDALTLIAASNGTPASISFAVVMGTTYYLQLAVDTGAPGASTLNWAPGSPGPANDNFANAITITGASGTIAGSNVGATVEPGEPTSEVGAPVHTSIWYNWTAPASANVTFDTFGSDYDTVLIAYTGAAVNALTFIAGNDDFGGSQSQITFAAVMGTTYRIRVDGFDGSTGNVTLNWS